MSELEALKTAAARAIDYIEGLQNSPVGPRATARELRARLDKPLQDAGLPGHQVIEELAHDVADGLMGSTSGRFFGWVIGGALPAAIAADWLTSAWDQNAPAYASSPAAAIAAARRSSRNLEAWPAGRAQDGRPGSGFGQALRGFLTISEPCSRYDRHWSADQPRATRAAWGAPA